MTKLKEKWEFGDFQTPLALARKCCERVKESGYEPKTVIEPTCGCGNFVIAALETFETARAIYAFDVKSQYVDQLRERLPSSEKVRIVPEVADFFAKEWYELLDAVEWPILILGNPPWVTSAELAILNSSNSPKKANFRKYTGFDAVTGKSNFDISEWMLLSHVDWIAEREGTIAMLCKTAVARKILRAKWKKGEALYNARMYIIDTLQEFEASVEACLFVCDSAQSDADRDCAVFRSLSASEPDQAIGYRRGCLVSDADTFDRREYLFGRDACYRWRSGLKHDCSSVMELTKTPSGLFNGRGEYVDIEQEIIYPLLKSSEVASGGKLQKKERYVIVTQNKIGQKTEMLKYKTPKAWQYLNANRKVLDKRASRIYKTNPSFSIFGVGPYSFEPWKVAISGLYKQLSFIVIGPRVNKPTMVDDTVYFLACRTEKEASTLARWLNSKVCSKFLESMIFWKDKRPIKVDVLKCLNIREFAKEHGEEHLYEEFIGKSEGIDKCDQSNNILK